MNIGASFLRRIRPLMRPAVRASGCKMCNSDTTASPFHRAPSFHRLFCTPRTPASTAPPTLKVNIAVANTASPTPIPSGPNQNVNALEANVQSIRINHSAVVKTWCHQVRNGW